MKLTCEPPTLVATLLGRQLRTDPADPCWHDRDRLIASEPGFAAAEALPPARGQHLGIAVGCALAERMLAARFGRSLVDHRTWAILDPAELATGAAQEAAALAGSLGLSRLCVIVPAGEAAPAAGFTALGWAVRPLQTSCPDAAEAMLGCAQRSRRPTLILCSAAGSEPVETLGRGAASRRAWLKRLTRHPLRLEFDRMMRGLLPCDWRAGLVRLFADPAAPRRICTAETIRLAMQAVSPLVPELVGGCPAMACAPAEMAGQFVRRDLDWGGRQQAMAGALSGLALHGGFLPVGGAALAGADVLWPALRTAARSRWRMILLLHEDAQGSEAAETGAQLAALRGVANLHVFRPADAAEALECGEIALRRTDGPSAILLSSAHEPAYWPRVLRPRCVHGAYVLHEPAGERDATVIASGRELALAVAVGQALGRRGLRVGLVSMPCWQLFARQEAQAREALLGDAPRVAIEPGEGFGWDRWLGREGLALAPEADADAERMAGRIAGHIAQVRRAA